MKLADSFEKLKRNIKKRPGKNVSAAGRAEKRVFISPESEMGGAYKAVGLVLRACVVFAGIFGLMLFFFDAVGIYNPRADFRVFTLPLYVIILSAAVAAALSVTASLNRICRAAVPLGSAVLLFLTAQIAYGNAALFFENTARRLYNDVLYGISSVGYTSFAEYMVNDSYSFGKESLVVWAAILTAALLAVVMYFAVVRKVRMWLVTITTALFAVPVLSMNISRSNGGFTFTVAFAAGCIVMKAYESRYSGRYDRLQEKKRLRRLKREQYRTLKNEKRIEKLKAASVSEKVYSAAVTAEMGTRRARLAAKTVKRRCIYEIDNEYKQKRSAVRSDFRRMNKESAKSLKNKEKSDASEMRRLKTRSVAAGGFAGGAALLAALLVLWIPAAFAAKPFKIIEPIERRVSQVRRAATAYLMGDDVNLNASGDYLYGADEKFGYEKLTFEPREYKNLLIFKAESGRRLPVYLKSRSALDYNMNEDSWNFADSRFVMNYNDSFGKGFSPDSITANAYAYLYPSSNTVPPSTGINFSTDGFYVQKISLTRINGDSKLFFTPSVINRSAGILDKGKDTVSPYRVAAYFDGVYTSHYFGADSDGYSAVAYLHDMRLPGMGKIFGDEERLLAEAYSLCQKLNEGKDSSELQKEAESIGSGMSIKSDLATRLLTDMTAEERESFAEFAESELAYRRYAEETYAKASGNEKLKGLADELLGAAEAEKGGGLTVYEKVMLVKNYLGSDDFKYTLTPSPGKGMAGVLETFLFETKEGYCAHFATAAVMLLREMGVSVRYCEGYLADGWYVNYGTEASDRYRSDVTDSDAHTWIEVYHNGIGWINYEVTKPYFEQFYSPANEKAPENMSQNELIEEGYEKPENKPHYSDDDVIITPDDYISDEEAERLLSMQILKWTLIIGAVLAVLAAVLTVLVKIIDSRVKKAARYRYSLVADAKNEEKYRDSRFDKRRIAKEIINSLFEILNSCGMGPEKGEQLSAFAERTERENPGLSSRNYSEVMRCIVKEEYGHGLSYKEMCLLADFYSDVMVTVGMGLSFSQKIKLRYIRRII